jgi:hypothetical protein
MIQEVVVEVEDSQSRHAVDHSGRPCRETTCNGFEIFQLVQRRLEEKCRLDLVPYGQPSVAILSHQAEAHVPEM